VFTGLLNQIINRTQGAETAMLVGNDGIIIERTGGEKGEKIEDFDTLAAEYAMVMQRSRFTASDTGLGKLSEMLTITDQTVLLTRMVDADFFVMIKLNPSCNLGRARYEVRRAELMMEVMLAE
jgi:predicted regulator of Ras-like GTPase activity (Roadblock/LC7/MglB family)